MYVLSNAAYPGLLKIGFTRKVPNERAAELDTTGVPTPFVVEYYCLVEGDTELEASVHRLLASQRHRDDRQFFRIELGDAVAHIQRICPAPEHSWSRAPLAMPRPNRVACTKCGARYLTATHCPKCRVRLEW